MTEQCRGRGVKIPRKAGDVDESAHHEKQRHRHQVHAAKHLRRLGCEKGQRRGPLGLQRERDDADRDHRKGERNMQRDQDEQRHDAGNADTGRRHAALPGTCRSRAPTISSISTKLCTATAAQRMPSTTNQNGAFGQLSSQVTSPARIVLMPNR